MVKRFEGGIDGRRADAKRQGWRGVAEKEGGWQCESATAGRRKEEVGRGKAGAKDEEGTLAQGRRTDGVIE